MTPGMFLTMVWKAVEEWMNGQGRFFPVAGLQGQLTLYFFKSDLSLAIFYGIFICLTIFCWLTILDKLFDDKITGTYFLLISIVMIRFRGNFDPHIGFAQLVIWSFFWVCISILFLMKSIVRNQKVLYSVISGLIYFVALCQYEMSLIAFPVILLISYTYFEQTNKTNIRGYLNRISPLIIATLSYLIFVFGYLRPRANPTGNYVSGFDFEKSSEIFFKTVFAVIPQFGLGVKDIFLLPKQPSSVIMVAFLSLVYLIVLHKYFTSSVNYKNIKKSNRPKTSSLSIRLLSTRSLILVFLSMGILIVGPSLILAIQPNWWGYFQFGQTYLGIFYSEIGLSSIFAIALRSMNLQKQVKKNEK